MSTIIFVHALGSSSRAWEPQHAGLSDRFRVLAPDLPGHGQMPGRFTLEGAAAGVDDLIKSEPEPVALVGISVGATVAMLAALADPTRVSSLILSGGTAHAPNVGVQRTMMRLMPQALIVKLMSGMYAGGRPEYREQASEDLRTAGKRAFINGLGELGDLDLRPRLTKLRQPALILCGEKDKENIKPAGELATAIPGAERRIVPGAGHIWNLQQPDRFNQTVADFLG